VIITAKIYLDSPNVGPLEKEYLNRCIDSSFVSTYGPFVPEFENIFSNFLNITGSVALQSGTAALHMALHELGIGAGDEVIVPVLTFIATANAVQYVGAKPVFVDVDPVTWNIDPDLTERAVTERTKAIIPVHLYGNPCEMSKIMKVARKHGLYVIEDATESLGSKYDGQYTGTFGDFGVFSFNGNKLMTTGGGGMITSADPERLRHIKYIINQARDDSNSYTHSEIGFNYRMTNLEAALGLAQMERIGTFIQKKRDFADTYHRKFQGRNDFKLQQPYDESETVWWLVSGILNKNTCGLSIQQIKSELLGMNIPTREVFKPLVDFPPYKEDEKDRYPNAYQISHSGISLPGSTLNGLEEIRYIADTLSNTLDKSGYSNQVFEIN
jgi:perosamine synthetase